MRSGNQAGTAHDPHGEERTPTPSPELTPARVLTAVIRALADNDLPEPDHGVRVLHAFASDRMRAAIGDLDALRSALHNDRNAPLVRAAAVEAESLEQRGDSARAWVAVTDSGGVRARFAVALARARHGARRGCWLVSGIAREGVDL